MNRYLKSATLKTLLGRYAGIVLFAFALSACGGGNKNETGATDTSAKPAPPMSALNAAPPVATKSAKRGIAYGFQSQADITALAGGISWWYNWALKPDAAVSNSSQNLNLDFTAMAWGGTPTVDGLLKDIPASVRLSIWLQRAQLQVASQYDAKPGQLPCGRSYRKWPSAVACS